MIVFWINRYFRGISNLVSAGIGLTLQKCQPEPSELLQCGNRGVAQLVARSVRDAEVRGSSPRTPTRLRAQEPEGLRYFSPFGF